ncbi:MULTISPECIES: thioredoxin family protein [unclassified Nostoc]|uniref:thioredoxin family protein n=1 Tax=unclassified Nostoc TaxID=2593658 RepID=UPI000B955940|nr:thioredoxin family protein [Nostoc sp. 'Peltigera membranacea cyanobiont' 232]OYE03801.1 redoxin [Nostoc sp. 'Peltigera membranacea cyanobiont' 232]
MNHNLLHRRQLLFYIGLGVVGIGAATTLSNFRKVNAPSISPAISNNTQDSESIAVKTPVGKSLPEFQGISQWLNSTPLAIADLKGSVILIQFWTFACINCQRTLPYITKWHRQYEAQGLKVIGIHTPEFAFERDPNNIKKALQKHQITYPVPVDNEYKTWNAYENQYWPHIFLADRQGLLQYDHIGEGAYEKIEQTIRQLLG